QRAQRAVAYARDQNRAVRRLAFASEVAARNTSGSIQLFFIIHAQWEEVDAFTGMFAHRRSSEYQGIAHANRHRAARLLGKAPGFDGDCFTTEFGCEGVNLWNNLFR